MMSKESFLSAKVEQEQAFNRRSALRDSLLSIWRVGHQPGSGRPCDVSLVSWFGLMGRVFFFFSKVDESVFTSRQPTVVFCQCWATDPVRQLHRPYTNKDSAASL